MRVLAQEGLTWGAGSLAPPIATTGFTVWGGQAACRPATLNTDSFSSCPEQGLLAPDGGRDPARAQLSGSRGGPAYHWGISRAPRLLLLEAPSTLRPSLQQRTCRPDPRILQKHLFASLLAMWFSSKRQRDPMPGLGGEGKLLQSSR